MAYIKKVTSSKVIELNEKLEGYKNKIVDYQKFIIRSKDELESLRRVNIHLEKELEDVKIQLKDKTKCYDALAKKYGYNMDLYSKSHTKLSNELKKYKNLNSNCDNLINDVLDNVDKLNEVNPDDALSVELSNVIKFKEPKTLDDLDLDETELTALELIIKQLENKYIDSINKMKKEITSLKEDLKREKSNSTDLEASLENQMDKCIRLATEVDYLKIRSRTETEISLEKKLDDLKTQNEELVKILFNKDIEIKFLKDYKESKLENFKNAPESVLHKEILRYQNEISVLKNNNTTLTNQIAAMQKEKDKMVKEKANTEYALNRNIAHINNLSKNIPSNKFNNNNKSKKK